MSGQVPLAFLSAFASSSFLSPTPLYHSMFIVVACLLPHFLSTYSTPWGNSTMWLRKMASYFFKIIHCQLRIWWFGAVVCRQVWSFPRYTILSVDRFANFLKPEFPLDRQNCHTQALWKSLHKSWLYWDGYHVTLHDSLLYWAVTKWGTVLAVSKPLKDSECRKV